MKNSISIIYQIFFFPQMDQIYQYIITPTQKNTNVVRIIFISIQMLYPASYALNYISKFFFIQGYYKININMQFTHQIKQQLIIFVFMFEFVPYFIVLINLLFKILHVDNVSLIFKISSQIVIFIVSPLIHLLVGVNLFISQDNIYIIVLSIVVLVNDIVLIKLTSHFINNMNVQLPIQNNVIFYIILLTILELFFSFSMQCSNINIGVFFSVMFILNVLYWRKILIFESLVIDQFVHIIVSLFFGLSVSFLANLIFSFSFQGFICAIVSFPLVMMFITFIARNLSINKKILRICSSLAFINTAVKSLHQDDTKHNNFKNRCLSFETILNKIKFDTHNQLTDYYYNQISDYLVKNPLIYGDINGYQVVQQFKSIFKQPQQIYSITQINDFIQKQKYQEVDFNLTYLTLQKIILKYKQPDELINACSILNIQKFIDFDIFQLQKQNIQVFHFILKKQLQQYSESLLHLAAYYYSNNAKLQYSFVVLNSISDNFDYQNNQEIQVNLLQYQQPLNNFPSKSIRLIIKYEDQNYIDSTLFSVQNTIQIINQNKTSVDYIQKFIIQDKNRLLLDPQQLLSEIKNVQNQLLQDKFFICHKENHYYYLFEHQIKTWINISNTIYSIFTFIKELENNIQSFDFFFEIINSTLCFMYYLIVQQLEYKDDIQLFSTQIIDTTQIYEQQKDHINQIQFLNELPIIDNVCQYIDILKFNIIFQHKKEIIKDNNYKNLEIQEFQFQNKCKDKNNYFILQQQILIKFKLIETIFQDCISISQQNQNVFTLQSQLNHTQYKILIELIVNFCQVVKDLSLLFVQIQDQYNVQNTVSFNIQGQAQLTSTYQNLFQQHYFKQYCLCKDISCIQFYKRNQLVSRKSIYTCYRYQNLISYHHQIAVTTLFKLKFQLYIYVVNRKVSQSQFTFSNQLQYIRQLSNIFISNLKQIYFLFYKLNKFDKEYCNIIIDLEEIQTSLNQQSLVNFISNIDGSFNLDLDENMKQKIVLFSNLGSLISVITNNNFVLQNQVKNFDDLLIFHDLQSLKQQQMYHKYQQDYFNTENLNTYNQKNQYLPLYNFNNLLPTIKHTKQDIEIENLSRFLMPNNCKLVSFFKGNQSIYYKKQYNDSKFKKLCLFQSLTDNISNSIQYFMQWLRKEIFRTIVIFSIIGFMLSYFICYFTLLSEQTKLSLQTNTQMMLNYYELIDTLNQIKYIQIVQQSQKYNFKQLELLQLQDNFTKDYLKLSDQMSFVFSKVSYRKFDFNQNSSKIIPKFIQFYFKSYQKQQTHQNFSIKNLSNLNWNNYYQQETRYTNNSQFNMIDQLMDNNSNTIVSTDDNLIFILKYFIFPYAKQDSLSPAFYYLKLTTFTNNSFLFDIMKQITPLTTYRQLVLSSSDEHIESVPLWSMNTNINKNYNAQSLFTFQDIFLSIQNVLKQNLEISMSSKQTNLHFDQLSNYFYFNQQSVEYKTYLGKLYLYSLFILIALMFISLILPVKTFIQIRKILSQIENESYIKNASKFPLQLQNEIIYKRNKIYQQYEQVLNPILAQLRVKFDLSKKYLQFIQKDNLIKVYDKIFCQRCSILSSKYSISSLFKIFSLVLIFPFIYLVLSNQIMIKIDKNALINQQNTIIQNSEIIQNSIISQFETLLNYQILGDSQFISQYMKLNQQFDHIIQNECLIYFEQHLCQQLAELHQIQVDIFDKQIYFTNLFLFPQDNFLNISDWKVVNKQLFMPFMQQLSKQKVIQYQQPQQNIYIPYRSNITQQEKDISKEKLKDLFQYCQNKYNQDNFLDFVYGQDITFNQIEDCLIIRYDLFDQGLTIVDQFQNIVLKYVDTNAVTQTVLKYEQLFQFIYCLVYQIFQLILFSVISLRLRKKQVISKIHNNTFITLNIIITLIFIVLNLNQLLQNNNKSPKSLPQSININHYLKNYRQQLHSKKQEQFKILGFENQDIFDSNVQIKNVGVNFYEDLYIQSITAEQMLITDSQNITYNDNISGIINQKLLGVYEKNYMSSFVYLQHSLYLLNNCKKQKLVSPKKIITIIPLYWQQYCYIIVIMILYIDICYNIIKQIFSLNKNSQDKSSYLIIKPLIIINVYKDQNQKYQLINKNLSQSISMTQSLQVVDSELQNQILNTMKLIVEDNFSLQQLIQNPPQYISIAIHDVTQVNVIPAVVISCNEDICQECHINLLTKTQKQLIQLLNTQNKQSISFQPQFNRFIFISLIIGIFILILILATIFRYNVQIHSIINYYIQIANITYDLTLLNNSILNYKIQFLQQPNIKLFLSTYNKIEITFRSFKVPSQFQDKLTQQSQDIIRLCTYLFFAEDSQNLDPITDAILLKMNTITDILKEIKDFLDDSNPIPPSYFFNIYTYFSTCILFLLYQLLQYNKIFEFFASTNALHQAVCGK